jgi:hypothetical protein
MDRRIFRMLLSRPTRHVLPGTLKFTDAEIAQACDPGVELVAVRQGRSDLYARHRRSGRSATRFASGRLAASLAYYLVDPITIGFYRVEGQLKPFTDDASEKTSHRVLLPIGGLHDCSDCGSLGRPQHFDDT